MSLRICSLSSGSSGNCYVVRTEDTVLLVDAGISGKQIRERLAQLAIAMDEVDGILITHEHSDHIKGLPALLKLNRRIYGSKGTLANCRLDGGDLFQEVVPGESFSLGSIRIDTFATSHDAAQPMGYSFQEKGLEKRISIITDTGIVTEEISRQIKLSHILVLESNHDENILKMGPYPWFLKQRILGEKGHLSNTAASEALAEVVSGENSEKKRLVLLAHLSKENNFPEMALATMENILRDRGCSANACRIYVLGRNEVSEFYE